MNVHELVSMLTDIEIRGGERVADERKVAKLEARIKESSKISDAAHNNIVAEFNEQAGEIARLRDLIANLESRLGEANENLARLPRLGMMDLVAAEAMSNSEHIDDLAQVIALQVKRDPKFTSGNRKIPAIKALRSLTGSGLKEAKEAIERAGECLFIDDLKVQTPKY